mmetsp:Transcript_17617/g.48725  ORF Transcript_17617/g.48725 Transcript_17617/m.48725 type:complete len:222 (+) Transcript_17617:366-1031(+)
MIAAALVVAVAVIVIVESEVVAVVVLFIMFAGQIDGGGRDGDPLGVSEKLADGLVLVWFAAGGGGGGGGKLVLGMAAVLDVAVEATGSKGGHGQLVVLHDVAAVAIAIAVLGVGIGDRSGIVDQLSPLVGRTNHFGLWSLQIVGAFCSNPLLLMLMLMLLLMMLRLRSVLAAAAAAAVAVVAAAAVAVAVVAAAVAANAFGTDGCCPCGTRCCLTFSLWSW